VNASTVVALNLGPSQAYHDHFAMIKATLIAGAATAIVVWTVLKCVVVSNGYVASIRLAAAHFLVYLLSGAPNVPPSPLTSTGKISERNSEKGRRRMSLTLDMGLDQDMYRFSPSLSTRGSRVQKSRKHLSPPMEAAVTWRPLYRRAVFQLGGPEGRSFKLEPGMVTTAEFKLQKNKQEQVPAEASKARTPVKTGTKPDIRDIRRVREELLGDDEFEAMNLDVDQSMEDYWAHLEQVYEEEAIYEKAASQYSVKGAFECEYGFDWEVEDTYWAEPRAARPASGRPMDGADVGHLPARSLELPRAALTPTQYPIYGRSVMSSQWDIPTTWDSQVTARVESHDAPLKQSQGGATVAPRLKQEGGTKVSPPPD